MHLINAEAMIKSFVLRTTQFFIKEFSDLDLQQALTFRRFNMAASIKK